MIWPLRELKIWRGNFYKWVWNIYIAMCLKFKIVYIRMYEKWGWKGSTVGNLSLIRYESLCENRLKLSNSTWVRFPSPPPRLTKKLGRRGIGIELKKDYCNMAIKRIKEVPDKLF